MITEKTIYVTEDGSEFGSKESAQHHLKLKKFRKDLIVFLGGKDLTSRNEDTIFQFIVENSTELHYMLLELDGDLK